MKTEPNIWVVDDDQSIRWVLEKALKKKGLSPHCFANPAAALKRLAQDPPDIVISDIKMRQMNGLELLQNIRQRAPAAQVIIMTAFSHLDHAISAFQGGAFEYLSKPFDVDEIVNIVMRALAESEQAPIGKPPKKTESTAIIGSAPAMQTVFRTIARLSGTDLTVLITGESGTGKELVARALHQHSRRAMQRFIALNTAAIPRELLESELFGHEKGAFTGAAGRRLGWFEQADGGTLFLDEIGDMPIDLQTRLLRILVDGEFYRVGGRAPIKADVRIIAATHQNIEEKVAAGNFREDLLHRLNVIRVRVPSIRERREDIAELLDHFLDLAAHELDCAGKVLLPETAQWLRRLDWSGNVRQLENFCRWITAMAPGKEIHIEDLPEELRAAQTDNLDWEDSVRAWAAARLAGGANNLLAEALPKLERIMLEQALKQTGGKRQAAAKLLGWGRNTLSRKIKELKLE